MLQTHFSTKNAWIFLIIVTSSLAVLAAILSLSRGIDDMFPFFFLVPMFLAIYRFPKMGVIFTVALGWINLSLVYLLGSFSVRTLAVHTAWFYIYVSLGIVISSIVVNSRSRKDEIELLKKQAFRQIEHNMEQFETLNDQIRNPLQAILLDADTITHDAETKESISTHVHTIEEILRCVDERILESHKVRNFLRKYYNFE